MANPMYEAFYESLDRCLLAPHFLTRFYELFLGSSAEVREKFQGTEFTRLTGMLRASLQMTLATGYGSPESAAHLERLATLHGPGGHNIQPHLYGFWVEALICAAQEHDPEFSPALEAEWRAMLAPGVRILTAGFRQPPD